MLGYAKLAIAAIVLSGAAGAFVYVKTLQSDLAVSKANNIKLESAVSDQKAVIEQQKLDMNSIIKASKELTEKSKSLELSIKNLEDKFEKVNSSGEKRDIGNLTKTKPAIMAKVFNKATINSIRCTEIAMGAPLTDKEKNATKKSEINPECSDLANPNYISTP